MVDMTSLVGRTIIYPAELAFAHKTALERTRQRGNYSYGKCVIVC